MPGQYAQSWLDWEAQSGGRSVLHGTPDEIKAMYAGLSQALKPMAPPFSENVDVTEGDVDGIKYRIYKLKGERGPLPIAFNTHGGGWMVGDLDTDHLLCGVIAEHTKSVVVNVDYRLTPDVAYPVPLEDSLKVYKWAAANASSFGGDPDKFYTIGGSAGGALALQIANKIKKDPQLKDGLKGVVALVPATTHWEAVPEKYKSKYKAVEDNKTGVPIIDGESMEIFFKYAKVDPSDPDTFTLLAEDNHKNFPPTYFASCEFDPLRDDAYVMEAALKEAGVPTKHDHYPGMPHYFWLIPTVPESKIFVENLLQGIGWILSQMKGATRSSYI
ncbi:esterase-like protein [Dothistroma septosporum NZE10]|uniref:Versiconal hemiacetal acetate esterase n=1 Tax=Dothistroma septosporum (strain NZE10 / CBS 128990) TaxID=675120 RepID=EST1_DOTSN|nr:RecName: Full=Versiconal hemiacetal acetate esterase; AltName: Full=Dothistromin biosynthesis protein est1; AltName: Full=Esterase 1 [Dothistroma septosporum NZE10]EME38960.1 esterase-like protein [Dothistroma septosporum NZE10]